MHLRCSNAALVAAIVGSTSIAQACSGPGSMGIMSVNHWLGYALLPAAVIPLALTAAIRFHARRMPGWLGAVFLLFVALHSSWWVSAYRGDCGMTRRELAFSAAGMALGVLHLTLLWRARNPRWRPMRRVDLPLQILATTQLMAAYVLVVSKVIGLGVSGYDWCFILAGWAIGAVAGAALEILPSTRFCPRRGRVSDCDECGYDLRGCLGPTCPECGAAMMGQVPLPPLPDDGWQQR